MFCRAPLSSCFGTARSVRIRLRGVDRRRLRERLCSGTDRLGCLPFHGSNSAMRSPGWPPAALLSRSSRRRAGHMGAGASPLAARRFRLAPSIPPAKRQSRLGDWLPACAQVRPGALCSTCPRSVRDPTQRLGPAIRYVCDLRAGQICRENRFSELRVWRRSVVPRNLIAGDTFLITEVLVNPRRCTTQKCHCKTSSVSAVAWSVDQ